MYNSMASQYRKLEENFGGFINRRLVRFEFEKSTLHTIRYLWNWYGEDFFNRQYLKLCSDQDQEHDPKRIIPVCKDERDWIDPENGDPYAGFDMGDTNVITTQNILKYQNSVIVLDDMGDKLDSHKKIILQRKT